VSASFFAPGALIAGRYQVQGELGRGGAAVVYAARDQQVGAEVALKVLVPPPAVAHLVRARTRREIRAVRALNHPNVVPIFDLLEEGPFTVLVMERVAGSDLQTLVAERGPLPAEQVAALGQGVAEALAAAHRAGIVHRDVKPRNILVDGAGRPRLTDFGAARVDGQETLTETGGLIGTLDYAAPEVMAGGRGDARADLHALGLTLYFALTGTLPARAASHLPPAPVEDGYHPRAVRPEVPPWLDAVVARATAADPRRRFPTAAGLAQALATHSLARLPEPAAPGRLDFCLACGAPDPFGRTLCRACADGAPAGGRAWLLVAPPRPPAERVALAARIADLLHVPVDDPGARAAAAGQRALSRLPQTLAEKAARQLQARGVPARVISTRSDLRLLPLPLVLLATATAALGTWAGLLAQPTLLFSTPPVVGLLLTLAYRAVGKPLFAPPPQDEETLPPALVTDVSRALTGLPDGESRALLADVVRLGRSLLRHAGPDATLRDSTELLLATTCQAAAELTRLEQALVQLTEQRARLPRVPESWMAEHARLDGARTALLQHLLDAVAALGSAVSEAAQPDADVSQALARASRDLHDELTLRAQSRAEVEATLSPAPGP
jgi:predicted Ser/Thr protein kinase